MLGPSVHRCRDGQWRAHRRRRADVADAAPHEPRGAASRRRLRARAAVGAAARRSGAWPGRAPSCIRKHRVQAIATTTASAMRAGACGSARSIPRDSPDAAASCASIPTAHASASTRDSPSPTASASRPMAARSTSRSPRDAPCSPTTSSRVAAPPRGGARSPPGPKASSPTASRWTRRAACGSRSGTAGAWNAGPPTASCCAPCGCRCRVRRASLSADATSIRSTSPRRACGSAPRRWRRRRCPGSVFEFDPGVRGTPVALFAG